MIPRIGTPPKANTRYHLRPGAYALLPRGRKLLLTIQHCPQNGPEWQLPGGGIDPGEATLPALHREVWEETGWHIAAPRRLTVFRRFVFMPEYDLWAEKLCNVYLAHPVCVVSPPHEPHHEACWLCPQEAMARLVNPGDRAALALWLARKRLKGGQSAGLAPASHSAQGGCRKHHPGKRCPQ